MIRLLFVFLCLPLMLGAAETRILFLGDSITQDGRWATLVEGALRNTDAYRDAEIVNMGLGSETVSGLSEDGHAGGKFSRPDLHERLGRLLTAYKPTLVFACYGMNDGIYLPLDPQRQAAHVKGAIRLKAEVEKIGGRIIFLSAPLFMPDTPEKDTQGYDKVLDTYAAWLVSMRAEGWETVDIRPDLKRAVADEKAKDPSFIYAKDGVHPGGDGHRFIAEAAVKGLWSLLKLPGEPVLPTGDALKILSERAGVLEYAWLSETKHLRPGVKAGLPLDEAKKRADDLMVKYKEAVK
ncbi:GDSL-type esterase/lipase family protein [Luteolibacter sp. SL250]|uniref:GDSL-type esterase/lipase family protein n=1 Tax=Luteolibacter sp. SL250 TaxID=2995170 RepID=UPI00227212D2|nr:GDSL-type esterase/lipase family protein [Luteolibacter sp. SL250]WAC21736.1 GDSL-type esterase/lipase family protein [Luteolibacter sp. SL250]